MSQLKLIEAIPSNLAHEFAWWQNDVKSSNPSPNRPALSGRIEADVLIVGGGFTGLWTALTLRQASPNLRVAIFEACRCGDGASSRNGGNVHGYWGALPTLVPLFGVEKALESGRLGTLAQRKLAAFATAPGRDVWWEEHGYLRVATSPTQMAKLDSFSELARELGVPDTVRKLDKR
ncbi:FAD-dependent oxidoreductase, partial [Mesorhizobium sp. M7A.F.Ca.US.011.01.1.1]|uniref:NAD(P)/FAD-dependent oxidoreductase n=1 Tax=Mesorhizobium sp. M7A.F.Ca.US.011.01.1.1 TaxID=2496741 RepID=UPI000FCAA72C